MWDMFRKFVYILRLVRNYWRDLKREVAKSPHQKCESKRTFKMAEE